MRRNVGAFAVLAAGMVIGSVVGPPLADAAKRIVAQDLVCDTPPCVQPNELDGGIPGSKISSGTVDAGTLDTLDSSAFALSGHGHDQYLTETSGTAKDSELLDGLDSTGFSRATVSEVTDAELVHRNPTPGGSEVVTVHSDPAGTITLTCFDNHATQGSGTLVVGTAGTGMWLERSREADDPVFANGFNSGVQTAPQHFEVLLLGAGARVHADVWARWDADGGQCDFAFRSTRWE